jgi:hypothetical protein
MAHWHRTLRTTLSVTCLQQLRRWRPLGWSKNHHLFGNKTGKNKTGKKCASHVLQILTEMHVLQVIDKGKNN